MYLRSYSMWTVSYYMGTLRNVCVHVCRICSLWIDFVCFFADCEWPEDILPVLWYTIWRLVLYFHSVIFQCVSLYMCQDLLVQQTYVYLSLYNVLIADCVLLFCRRSREMVWGRMLIDSRDKHTCDMHLQPSVQFCSNSSELCSCIHPLPSCITCILVFQQHKIRHVLYSYILQLQNLTPLLHAI